MPIHWVIAAFNLTQDKALLYARAKNKPSLQHALSTAIDAGATVISIRLIHPIPEGRPLPDQPQGPPSNLDTSPHEAPDGQQRDKGQ